MILYLGSRHLFEAILFAFVGGQNASQFHQFQSRSACLGSLGFQDRADSIKKKERLSDASTTMRNASMGKRGRRKPTSLFFLRKRTKWGQCIHQLKTEKPRQLKVCSSSRQNELLARDRVYIYDYMMVAAFFGLVQQKVQSLLLSICDA